MLSHKCRSLVNSDSRFLFTFNFQHSDSSQTGNCSVIKQVKGDAVIYQSENQVCACVCQNDTTMAMQFKVKRCNFEIIQMKS